MMMGMEMMMEMGMRMGIEVAMWGFQSAVIQIAGNDPEESP